MEIQWTVALAGLLVGFVVGLTGMGGGALMTPMMILLFGVQPLAAVSSDLVASMVMKPVGGAVHARRGTVHRGLVLWMVIGSVPSAFAGVLLLRWLGNEESTEAVVKASLGVALLVASGAMVAKAMIDLRAKQRALAAGTADEAGADAGTTVRVRRVPTLAVGVLGGLVVGMTSVGSGSLMIVALLLLYPGLRAGQLVGTDLVQAVPLVASASLGHLLFGDFQLGLTASLLIGALPGVYIGARVSSQAPGGVVRRALVVVLLASGLKLLDAPNGTFVAVFVGLALLGPLLWASVFLSAHRSRRAHL
ncbi:MAG: sulfite exporter TauE/SafE family protein, partial [Actinomycetes bacterium]